jgi:hypothetical protein
MDGADVHAGDVVRKSSTVGDDGKEGADAFLKLECGFFSKSGEVDFVWTDALINDQIEGTPQENTGLAGPGTGGEVKRTVDVKDSSLLVIVGLEPSCFPEFFYRRKFTGHSHSPMSLG